PSRRYPVAGERGTANPGTGPAPRSTRVPPRNNLAGSRGTRSTKEEAGWTTSPGLDDVRTSFGPAGEQPSTPPKTVKNSSLRMVVLRGAQHPLSSPRYTAAPAGATRCRRPAPPPAPLHRRAKRELGRVAAARLPLSWHLARRPASRRARRDRSGG